MRIRLQQYLYVSIVYICMSVKKTGQWLCFKEHIIVILQ